MPCLAMYHRSTTLDLPICVHLSHHSCTKKSNMLLENVNSRKAASKRHKSYFCHISENGCLDMSKNFVARGSAEAKTSPSCQAFISSNGDVRSEFTQGLVKLLVAKGIATRSKDATIWGSWPYY